jgi:inosine-uridine nucleoside N-ribohydrolase
MGVWIDTDMGFDDIAAILVVTQSNLDIDGISLVFGNTPLPQVRINAAGAAVPSAGILPFTPAATCRCLANSKPRRRS